MFSNINEREAIANTQSTEKEVDEFITGMSKSFSTCLSVTSGCVLALSAGLLAIISRSTEKKAEKTIEDDLHKRFDALEKAIRAMYCRKSVVSRDDENYVDERCDISKIKGLISLYQDAIDDTQQEEKQRNTILLGLFSVIGTCVATALSEMERLGINIFDWFRFIIIVLLVATSIFLPVYFFSEIDEIKGKTKTMMKLLKQYLIYITEDDNEKSEKLSSSIGSEKRKNINKTTRK